MPVTPQTLWADLIQHIASRERSLESSVAGYGEYEPANPYWDHDEIEQFLLEISQRLLREMSPEMLQSCGPLAVQTLSGTTITLPANTIAVLGALQQTTVGDTYWKPAQQVSVSQWYQTYNAPAGHYARYAIVEDGTVIFKGNALQLVVVVEPALAAWQANNPILPPAAFDEDRIAWVHGKLSIQDFMPGDRI